MPLVCRNKKGQFVGKVRAPKATCGGSCLTVKGKFTKPMCAACKGRALKNPNKK